MNPWLSLDYPLTLREMKRLTWLQSKMAAVIHLAASNQPVDFAYARRLAFIRFLVLTGDLSEGVAQP